jgi:hypothetical protein
VPKEPYDTTFHVRLSSDVLRRIDDWRRRVPDLPSRGEAVRRLIEIALKAPRPTPRRPKP